MKLVEFVGDSLDSLRAFPDGARREAGFQLDRVQKGLEPFDWKPMPSIGPGVQEIRVRDSSGSFRVIFVSRLSDAVYVLHCFKKKTRRTSPLDVELARQRLARLMRSRR